MENSSLVNLNFDGNPVVAVNFRGRWCWMASQLSTAIGYQHPHRLASKVSGTWADEFVEGHDYDVLTGENLREFRGVLNLLDSSKFESAARRRTVILYESGLHLALLKTAMPKGRQLRRLLIEEVLPQLARDGRYDPDRHVTPEGTIAEGAAAEREERLLKLREADLALREAELGLRVRNTEAGALWRLRDVLREGGRIGADILESLAVTAAEVEAGRDLAALKPPADDSLDWESPTAIADRLGVTVHRVGRTITALKLRGDPSVSRAIVNKAAHSDRTVKSYLYSPEAVREIAVALGVGEAA